MAAHRGSSTMAAPRKVATVAAHVVVVEDDHLIGSSLERALVAKGYRVTLVGTVAGAIDVIDRDRADLVLLDLGLPDGDGVTVAGHVARHHPQTPVIALTARDAEIDVVLGLEAGVVDYIVKPFRLAELLARIGSHLRWRDAVLGPDDDATTVIGDLAIDRRARRVRLAGREVPLRPREFDLLERLARDAGAVLTREQLIDDVWDENWWGSTKTLDVHINAIRRKLGEPPGDRSRITTIRGVGYRLERESDR